MPDKSLDKYLTMVFLLCVSFSILAFFAMFTNIANYSLLAGCLFLGCIIMGFIGNFVVYRLYRKKIVRNMVKHPTITSDTPAIDAEQNERFRAVLAKMDSLDSSILLSALLNIKSIYEEVRETVYTETADARIEAEYFLSLSVEGNHRHLFAPICWQKRGWIEPKIDCIAPSIEASLASK